ncbi:GFA family protein [Roseobacteraceae bacterium S113]
MLKGQCLCGAVGWEYDDTPDEATVCNCAACRQYGAIWIYGNHGAGIRIRGETRAYTRSDLDRVHLAFHSCLTCGALRSWQPVAPEGRVFRMAVNLRLASPEKIADFPVRRFDGRDSWAALEGRARCVGDYII